MNMDITEMLTIMLAVLIGIIILLIIIYCGMLVKKNSKPKKDEKESENTEIKKEDTVTYKKLSVFDFMQFDKIEDNMIVQDDGKKFLMAIECEGINYDLMSEIEKNSVEAGFVQFLNTLRHPIQIYTQTRTLNIEDSIMNYNNKLTEIKTELLKKKNQYNKLLTEGDYSDKQIQDLKMETIRLENLYDYGLDVVGNIKKLSQNKNVLRKHYYIIVPYYADEIGSDLLSKDEQREMIFSELYTRAQAIVRTLFACSMKCRVLNSTELAELLYVAYNRDDAEIYGIQKAFKAGYSELYSTAPDVLDKKMQAINNQIEKEAVKLANKTIDDVRNEKNRRIKEKEDRMNEMISEMAAALIEEKKILIGKKVAEEAVEKIKKGSKTKEKEEVKDEKEQAKKGTRKPRTTKSA